MDIDIKDIIGILGGAGISAVIAKWAITNALSDLERLSNRVVSICEQIGAMAVRLESISLHSEQLREHSRKIAYIEGALCKVTEKR